jgi:hypothetical protein
VQNKKKAGICPHGKSIKRFKVIKRIGKIIKDLEARLAPIADGKNVILNSFSMSETRNVYTWDNSECIKLMINKILQQ